MGNMAHPLQFSDPSTRSNPYTNFQAAGYTREVMLSSRESSATGLTLETKDGDLVTLNTSSFSNKEAFIYDRAGVIQTEAGQAAFSHQYREITLTSGKSFSFSVEGDLSEEEIDDIEELLQGLDGVMSQMRQGNMEDALEQSLSLGGYDTVSSFSADLSYSRRVEVQSSYSAVAAQGASGKEIPTEGKESAQDKSLFDGLVRDKKAYQDHFFKLLHDLLQKRDEKTISLAKDPISQLFQHHIDESEKEKVDSLESMPQALESLMDKVDDMIMEMADKMLKPEAVEIEDD